MMNVRDVMTQPVQTANPATPLREVAARLVEHRISGVPVVDHAGTVVGVVSEADFLIKEEGRAAIHGRPFARVFGQSADSHAQLAKLDAVTAGQAMTSPAITISPGRSISEAAAIMTRRHVNRLPVVEDGVLVGIVTRADLVRAYVRSDEELAETIRDEVLPRNLWLDPRTFTVSIRDGVVSIAGRVERRSTAAMVERVLRSVPGVIDVQAAIEWSMDDAEVEPVTTDPVFPFGLR
jgi:CBS domain-containing protein